MTGCAVVEENSALVGVVPAEHMARKFDDCDLHAEADAEVRDAALARVLRGQDHALNAAVAEAAGD